MKMSFRKKPQPGRAPELNTSKDQSSILLSLRQSLQRIKSNAKADKQTELEGLIGKINGQLNQRRRKSS